MRNFAFCGLCWIIWTQHKHFARFFSLQALAHRLIDSALKHSKCTFKNCISSDMTYVRPVSRSLAVIDSQCRQARRGELLGFLGSVEQAKTSIDTLHFPHCNWMLDSGWHRSHPRKNGGGSFDHAIAEGSCASGVLSSLKGSNNKKPFL